MRSAIFGRVVMIEIASESAFDPASLKERFAGIFRAHGMLQPFTMDERPRFNCWEQFWFVVAEA